MLHGLNVKENGAKGDGQHKDTDAIQRTIDRCAQAGGGIVFFPPGTYLSGTIYLKDQICLELSPGAILLGSSDPKDYNADDYTPQNRAHKGEKASGAHLVSGVGLKNISIRGGGKIDGHASAFFAPPTVRGDAFDIPGWRPGQMIFLCECDNVRIENVELFNAAYWTCFLHGCNNVFIRGLQIFNDRRTINGDGIDVDCCRQVVISDCIIDTGDDCIALRGNPEPLTKPQPCEDIVITNCVLKTRYNGLRIGVGNGIIRRVVCSNLNIYAQLSGLCIQSNYCYSGNEHLDHSKAGVDISDVRFENIVMPEVCSALYIAPGYMGGKAIRDIYFHGIHAYAKKGSTIRGSSTMRLKHIVLSRVDVQISGEQKHLLAPDQWEEKLHEWDGCRPAALFLADCDDFEMDQSRIQWGDTTGSWLHAVWGQRMTDCRITHCRLAAPPGSNVALQLDDAV